MTSASMLREKAFATFYSKDKVTNQGLYIKCICSTDYVQIMHSPKPNRIIWRHPSFSDFTYHFPERIPNTIAPI